MKVLILNIFLTLHRVDKNSYFLKNDSIADLVEFGSLNGVYK